LKQKEQQETSKEGKKKKKGGKYKKMTTTKHLWKGPNNHHNHCNIDGHKEEKCQKLHLELNSKNKNKYNKKNNLMATDSSNQV